MCTSHRSLPRSPCIVWPLVFTMALPLRAQDAPPVPQDPPRSTRAPEGAPAGTQASQGEASVPQAADPFRADATLRSALGADRPGAGSFEPLGQRPTLPEMHLRGVVRMAGRDKPAALVEVAGFGSYTARQGDTISFTLPVRALPVPGPAATGDGHANRTALVRHATVPPAQDAPTPDPRNPQRNTPSPAAGQVASPGSGSVLVGQQLPIVLRVLRIDRDGVVVEIGTLGQYVVIR